MEAALSEFADRVASARGSLEAPRIPVYRALGRGELVEGRSLDALQAAYRLGARVAWRRYARVARRLALSTESVALLAEAVFTHIDEIAAASVQAYADAQADAAGTADRRRHRLLILLVTGGPDADTLRRAAAEADWPLPETVAAAALGPLPGAPPGPARTPGHGPAHPSGPVPWTTQGLAPDAAPGSTRGSVSGTAFGPVPGSTQDPAPGSAPGSTRAPVSGSPSGPAPGSAQGPASGTEFGPAPDSAPDTEFGPAPDSAPDSAAGNTRGPASRTAFGPAFGPAPDSAPDAVPGTDPGRAPPGAERAVGWGDHRSGGAGALRRYRLPEPVLADLEGAEPCLVIPSPHLLLADPRLQRLLRETAAVVGPAVPPAQAADSLRWARALRASGGGPAPGAAPVTDPSLARLLLLADPALVRLMASRHLRPLASLTAKQRDRVAATLLACLQTPHVTAPEIAARLGIHPQTARQRLHQVHRLFGALLADPDARFEAEAALRAAAGHETDRPPG
ncbi:helix-turn-helix domain-containing protein [Streptomyces collinus]|uniref:helix-turn-helix domain-containing protein n=1 Tax=Streptomyces collinus TaxID=42684 RepID=UPI0036AF4950